MNLKFASNLILILTIIVILMLGLHPAWYEHLHTDVNVYVDRVNYFLKNGDFKNLSGNEYQPGALFFFVAVHLITPMINVHDITLRSYLWKLLFVNIALILIIANLYKNYTNNYKSIFVFSLIILSSGPIALYRFDLFVMSIVIMSLFLQKKDKGRLSSFLLGIATMVKIFPVILLPYYILRQVKKRKFLESLRTFLAFAAGYISSFILVRFLINTPASSIYSSFSFYGRNYVHTESIWGTFLTLISWITTGEFAKGSGGWGIFGISPNYNVGPLWLYNYFWIIPIVLWYLWLFKRASEFPDTFDVKIPIVTMLIFLIFSKILHHQYLLWFMLLLPLVDPNLYFRQTKWFVLLMLVTFASFINQYVYPLNYTKWMFGFYADGSYSYLFWLIFLRNALLVSILILLIKSISERLAKHP